MTAGHVIDGIEQAIAAGQKLTSFHIDDNWSGRKVPDNTFAFDYARSNKFFINDPKSQADYGAIWLTDYTRTMLEGRIQPFDETDWRMLPNDFDQFERYVICGFPAQLLSNKVVDECVHSTKGLAIFELDKVDPPTHIKSSFPRFYGSRQSRTLTDKDGNLLSSLDGMSGCPIFGMNKVEKGWRIFLAGVQSSEYGTLAISCPFIHVGAWLEVEIAAQLAQATV